MNLKVEEVSAQRSFVFLWCGSFEGLDLGREVSWISVYCHSPSPAIMEGKGEEKTTLCSCNPLIQSPPPIPPSLPPSLPHSSLSHHFLSPLSLSTQYSGLQCLRKWGFRRCEDICWVKANVMNPGKSQHLDPKSVLQNTKVMCN